MKRISRRTKCVRTCSRRRGRSCGNGTKPCEQERNEAGEVTGGGEVEHERFELTPTHKSWFGKLFSDSYGGTLFTLQDGRRVQFGRRGKNRQRRYTVEIVTADSAVS